MNKKFNAIVSILLFASFIGAFVTGKMLVAHSVSRGTHELISIVALVLMGVHIVGYWPVIKCWFEK